jgi:hypothetical protein
VTGSPLLRAFVALGVLLLMLVPMRSFTSARARQAVPAAPSATPAKGTLARLEIVSTKAPFTYSVSHLGKVVWQGKAVASPAATDLELPIPPEGIDLSLTITWNEPGEAAAKLSVSHDENDPVPRTVWGDGSASDVLTFP